MGRSFLTVVVIPNPDRKKGRNNNRKQTFDAVCWKMLFRICKKHGLHLQKEPSYGGRGYLEKQVNGQFMWDFPVIKELLMSPVCIGAIASQKAHYRFKIGTIGDKKPEEWMKLQRQRAV